MRLPRIAFALLATAACLRVVAACSSFSSGDDPTDAAAETSTDATIDVTPMTDAAVVTWDSDGAQNLLVNGDFEGAGCGGWVSNNAALAVNMNVHRADGTTSCEVCVADAGMPYQIRQYIDVSIPDGVTFTGQAWVRAQTGGGPLSTVLNISTFNADGGTLDTLSAQSSSVASGFLQIDQILKTKAPVATRVQLLVQAVPANSSPGQSCFYIDDVTLYGKQ